MDKKPVRQEINRERLKSLKTSLRNTNDATGSVDRQARQGAHDPWEEPTYGDPGHFELPSRHPVPPEATSTCLSPWLIFVAIVGVVSIGLWFPVGLTYLKAHPVVGRLIVQPQPYKEWLLGTAKQGVAAYMYPAVAHVLLCMDAKDMACACAVTMPTMENLAAEIDSYQFEAGQYSRVHEALANVMGKYQSLRHERGSACSTGGSLALLNGPLNAYTRAHDVYVDRMLDVEQGE